MSKRIKKLDIIIPITQYGNLSGTLNNINYSDIKENQDKDKKDIENSNKENN